MGHDKAGGGRHVAVLGPPIRKLLAQPRRAARPGLLLLLAGVASIGVTAGGGCGVLLAQDTAVGAGMLNHQGHRPPGHQQPRVGTPCPRRRLQNFAGLKPLLWLALLNARLVLSMALLAVSSFNTRRWWLGCRCPSCWRIHCWKRCHSHWLLLPPLPPRPPPARWQAGMQLCCSTQ